MDLSSNISTKFHQNWTHNSRDISHKSQTDRHTHRQIKFGGATVTKDCDDKSSPLAFELILHINFIFQQAHLTNLNISPLNNQIKLHIIPTRNTCDIFFYSIHNQFLRSLIDEAYLNRINSSCLLSENLVIVQLCKNEVWRCTTKPVLVKNYFNMSSNTTFHFDNFDIIYVNQGCHW